MLVNNGELMFINQFVENTFKVEIGEIKSNSQNQIQWTMNNSRTI